MHATLCVYVSINLSRAAINQLYGEFSSEMQTSLVTYCILRKLLSGSVKVGETIQVTLAEVKAKCKTLQLPAPPRLETEPTQKKLEEIGFRGVKVKCVDYYLHDGRKCRDVCVDFAHLL